VSTSQVARSAVDKNESQVARSAVDNNESELRQLLHARQKLYQCVRAHFAVQKVLEVETPIRSTYGNTDPAIESVRAGCAEAADGAVGQSSSPQAAQSAVGPSTMWLRTSPEFFHKRLLAQGAGDLFEIAKVFRAGELSQRHREEFSMLEYYRLGYDERALMHDLANLLQACFAAFEQAPRRLKFCSYRDWFLSGLALDPLRASDAQLLQAAHEAGAVGQMDRDACLDLLRSHVLEPKLDRQTLFFVHDFPASQAALSRLNRDGETARRFELFCGGLELANGYFELTDAHEQRQRFGADNAKRLANSQIEMPIDVQLLTALELGLPSCAGVAVGLDRVLMLLLDVTDIAKVLAFPSD
jgi:elongation factor P--(R)-beta-lysine ligase